MLKKFVATAIILATFTMPASADTKDPVVVFAGSASQPPLEEAARVFEEQTGTRIILHLGGSGAMLSQIRLTGQGDIYIPGSPDYLEKARDFGLVDKAETLSFLVQAILVPKGNPHNIQQLEDLARPGLRIGMADPDGVCVGLYAVEILDKSGMTDRVRPNLNGFVESCAKTLAMLPLGMVDAVLGWREFIFWTPDTVDVVLIDPDIVPRLGYIPAARLEHAENSVGADKFIAFLISDQGRNIFRKWGYYTDEASVLTLAPNALIGGSYVLPEGW
ncbi:MAG: molybdate ABC transporter substrate-binding protein [Deltaproteobacteria bacterium]|jgi:molybdate transport system substrate-binding protein|nr:molybdate ABC transporter substrate-binding protein [Deltaproteobacteria bacterium]